MGSKMLIDAAHPEETRVVVVRGNRVEEFDYESAQRKQLKGNIYLAKVTRVEPSLQAAFVDYGGNRHGFLAFSEIHPDYYQIPVADRQALLEEEAEEQSRVLAEEAEEDERRNGRKTRGRRRRSRKSGHETDTTAQEDGTEAERAMAEAAAGGDVLTQELDAEGELPEPGDEESEAELKGGPEEIAGEAESDEDSGEEEEDAVESIGSEDVMEEVPVRVRRRRRRHYKIQEVIKRRQVILVQVVKEERGNKGAALTTYLSLAGRYTVLMPNTARGGGISRKITNAPDRKRLRKIADELDIAEGMGLIIRTAGASRTKTEIKRDCEYLLRMWETIRDLTLKSTAPALVYEEGNLIKRSIRDLYNKEIDEVLVAGEEAYKEAKGFMRMLMPSHAKNVKLYKDPEPIFVRHKIERQLSAMFSPYVTLKSGGYIVINQTEALVSIDVNSGKATREHSIEDTALKTNLEAAEEVARQLRLRDLAGLIVIDFIDMDERRNNRAVERKLKEALRGDRARIQIGRISHFGLLEMSRQRLRASMLEGTTDMCPVCQGMGTVRSTESVALEVLRSIEDTLISQGAHNLKALTSVDAALYILNQKRALLRDIENRYGVSVVITADPSFHGATFSIEKTAETSDDATESAVIQMDSVFQTPEQEQEQSEAAVGEERETDDDDGEAGRRKRRRRRRGRRGRSADRELVAEVEAETTLDGNGEPTSEDAEGGEEAEAAAPQEGGADGEVTEAGTSARRPRRRGRRGGRRTRTAAATADETESAQGEEAASGEAESGEEEPVTAAAEAASSEEVAPAQDEEEPEKKPARRTRRASSSAAPRSKRRSKTAEEETSAAQSGPEETGGEAVAQEKEKAAAEAPAGNGGESVIASPQVAVPAEEPAPAAEPAAPATAVQAEESDAGESAEARPRRRGWWQRGA